AGYDRQRLSENGPSPVTSGTKNPFDTFQANLNASWELDVWGRIRRSTEAARAELLASEEGRRAVMLSLVSSIAGSYINLRDLDKQLEIAHNTVKIREESLKIFTDRFEGGLISELELVQIKSQYEEALATIPQFEKAITQQENGLSVLLGRNPGPIKRGLTIDQLVLPEVPAGIPSDILTRRPDIRQAEENLIAANARIGVAKAAYFPVISLTGFFGFASTDLSDLFKSGSQVWQYSAPITAPIFTAGKIAGQVKAAEAVQQQTLVAYQQSIQVAFREVDDSLVDQNKTREQLKAQASQVDSLKKYYELARLRYDNGYTSYLEVLDAERSLFNVQLSYTQNQGVLFQALVNLYKAMGGGWVVNAEQLALAGAAGGTAAGEAYPCMDELEKFCKDIPPGRGELLLCLSKRKSELSATCSQRVDKHLAQLEEARKICAADMEKFCPGVEPGQGRLLKCMKPQIDKLTPACREKVEYYGKGAVPSQPVKQGDR
ncbi:MAG TPA: efflux transporter outer membrane subunit, partial [Geobacteraceae bacterium]